MVSRTPRRPPPGGKGKRELLYTRRDSIGMATDWAWKIALSRAAAPLHSVLPDTGNAKSLKARESIPVMRPRQFMTSLAGHFASASFLRASFMFVTFGPAPAPS